MHRLAHFPRHRDSKCARQCISRGPEVDRRQRGSVLLPAVTDSDMSALAVERYLPPARRMCSHCGMPEQVKTEAKSRMITRVALRNYKSIAACDVELAPLTILVGPNGAGKSNMDQLTPDPELSAPRQLNLFRRAA